MEGRIKLIPPSLGALLSKLETIFKMANSPPRITARTGWCSDRWDKEHHPDGVDKEGSRHFLVTPPPLLAVMRGGEFALFKMRPPTTYRCLNRAGRASQRLRNPNFQM